MATSSVEITEGTGAAFATHTITEGMETRHLSRVVVSNSTGSDISLATSTGQTSIIAAIEAWTGLTDTELRAAAVEVEATAWPLPTGAATAANQVTTNSKLDDLITAIDALTTAIEAM
jgi:hypothetical protein